MVRRCPVEAPFVCPECKNPEAPREETSLSRIGSNEPVTWSCSCGASAVRGVLKSKMHPIPLMTHRLSSAWDQPSRNEILVDDTHAVMSQKTFAKLKEYSTSQPSGCYEGKMWKSLYPPFQKWTDETKTELVPQKWYLRWFVPSDIHPETHCMTLSREVILL